MKHINLYQAAFHPPRTVLPARQLLAGGALFLGGLLAVYAWDAWRLTQLRQEVTQLTQQAAKLEASVNKRAAPRQADPQVLAEGETLETRLRNLQLAQQAVASGALGSEAGYSAQFRALARARVAGAWLTRIEIDERGREMNLYGRARSGEDSARLIASLRREPLLLGLSFASLTMEPPQAEKVERELGTAPAQATRKTAPPYLEFALSARFPVAAPPPAASVPGLSGLGGLPGLPGTVSLPELLAQQAAKAGGLGAPGIKP